MTDPRLRAASDGAAWDAVVLEAPAGPEALDQTVECPRTRQVFNAPIGAGWSMEYGVASFLTASRLSRVAPVSREMILNFGRSFCLGLPTSY